MAKDRSDTPFHGVIVGGGGHLYILSRRFKLLHLFGLDMPILVHTIFWEDLVKIDFRSKMAIFEDPGIPKCRF